MTVYKLRIMLFMLLSIAACTTEEEPQPNKPQPVMTDYIATQPDLSLFRKALERSGLKDAPELQSGGPFTFFAPVDSAMIHAGFTEQAISSYDPEALARILRYHILNGRLSSATLVGNYTQDAYSLEPGRLPKVTRNYHGIFLNGLTAIEPNIELGDGVLHKINGVSILSGMDMYDLIQSRQDLSFMAYFLRNVSSYDFESYLREPDTLSWKGDGYTRGITFIAPTDNAFRAEGYNTPEELMQEDPEYVATLLSAYLVAGRKFVSDWLDGGDFGRFGANVNYVGPVTDGYLVQVGGLTFKSARNLNIPRIIEPNILANNGVLHTVDKVIKP